MKITYKSSSVKCISMYNTSQTMCVKVLFKVAHL